MSTENAPAGPTPATEEIKEKEQEKETVASATPDADARPMPDQDTLLKALRTVRDPEVGVNIVDLGLIYTIQTHDGIVDLEMTLTTPACPAGPQILKDAIGALERVDGVEKANVRVVLTPPWTPERMSDDARDELGIY